MGSSPSVSQQAVFFALSALFLAALAGCTSASSTDTSVSEPGAAMGEPCNLKSTTTNGCEAENTCIYGTCEPHCTRDADCSSRGSGYACRKWTNGLEQSSLVCTPPSEGGTTSGAAYVEFVMDFSKYGVAPGQVVQRVEAENRSFTVQPIAKGTGSCSEKITFKGVTVAGSGTNDLFLKYTIYVRNYGSTEAMAAGVEYTNEQYAGGFRLAELTAGCTTLTVARGGQGGVGLILVPSR
jgi:hypothetical protein